MKITLTKGEALFLQRLLYSYMRQMPDDTPQMHGRFIGKLSKKMTRQITKQNYLCFTK